MSYEERYKMALEAIATMDVRSGVSNRVDDIMQKIAIKALETNND